MGEFQEFNAQRAHSALGTVAGIQAAYHFAPSRRIDPWLGLGTGYRWLWEVYNENHTQVLTQGLQMARLLVGLDIRTSQEFAIGPVIGADLDEFLSQGNGGITNPGVSTFVHAGLMGRFDIGTFDHRPPPPTEQDVIQVGVTAPQPPPPVVEAPPPPAPPAPPTIVYVPAPVVVEAPPPPVQPPTIVYLSPSISVSSDILHACELKVGNSPQFAFDDSKLNDEDRDALDAVAKCFATGPLAGKSMSLVGRADPRGSREYNLALGQRRASSVATYLTLHGIESNRIGKSSRGALDAEGTDEAGWANDRRVDITIAP
jgi:peptidoglycan-associated lipoprotein